MGTDGRSVNRLNQLSFCEQVLTWVFIESATLKCSTAVTSMRIGVLPGLLGKVSLGLTWKKINQHRDTCHSQYDCCRQVTHHQ